ncbi:MAG: T9SS type A sorting domain-containing protein [Carboxylicivirga sp.]|jgi:hypothetical protein|nr:T9SS type A sorting domain-containing protein [Carboxylicivirga sp.]
MKHFLLFALLGMGMFDVSAQSFETTTVASGVSDPLNITRIDLDKDGDQDILSFGGDVNIEFFSNNGDGTYTQKTLYNGPRGLSYFEVADMDNDTELDIVACDILDEKFVFLKNDGNENFTENIISNHVDVLNNPINFTIANFDTDDYKDIVVCASHANDTYGLFFLKNNGDGTFATPDEIEEDDFINKVVSTDIDGDNDIDIIISKNGMFTNGGLYKGINNGSGSFTYTAITTSEKFDDIKLFNMDGDNDMDFIARTNTNHWAWYENDGSANFTKNEISHPYAESNDLVEFYPFNIGNDNDMDLFFFSSIKGDTNMDKFDVGYYENDGDQNFTIHLLFEDQPEFAGAIPLDFNDDGDLDFFLASEDNSSIVFYKNLTFDTPTNIDSHENSNIKLFPNPVTDILMVECDENVHSIEISNLSGRVVYRKENKSQNMQVELSDLPSGVYNLVLVMDQQRVVKRIVKK